VCFGGIRKPTPIFIRADHLDISQIGSAFIIRSLQTGISLEELVPQAHHCILLGMMFYHRDTGLWPMAHGSVSTCVGFWKVRSSDEPGAALASGCYRLNRSRVCQRSPEARPGLGDVKQRNPSPAWLVGPADKGRVTTKSRQKLNATSRPTSVSAVGAGKRETREVLGR
jgi:hypothetical protein